MPSLNMLEPRRTCYYREDGRLVGCDSSSWHNWGRWVALCVLVVFGIIFFSIIGCINSRRRRRHGLQPRYGTGWMAPLPKYSQQAPPGHQQYYAPPPPAYAQQQNPNQAWGQPGGIPLQQPPQVHTGDYAPPTGPPPSK